MAYVNPSESFETLKSSVADTVKKQFPIEGEKHTLVANKVWVDDNLDPDDIRGQKDAKLKGRTWSVPVRAEFELRDKKTGKVKDRQTMTVAQLPKITRRYSYVVNGNEYQVNNLFRLKSGVYSRIGAGGDIEAQWNLAKGLGFRMKFDPKSKKMTMQYPKGANVPLYPVLKNMGVSDDEMERRWGKEILSANMKDEEEPALRKFYKSFQGTNPESVKEARKFLSDELKKTALRPDSTKLTLGKEFKKVNGESLLEGSHKLLRVSRREDEPDDRDSLAFKELWSAEDLLADRVERKHSWEIQRKIKNTIDKTGKVKQIVNPEFFGKPVRSFFSNSALSERPDQMNPISFTSGNRRTTLMAAGEGGIGTAHQVSLEAQSINPSHTGFLDPIQTPECYDEETEVLTKSGWKRWADVTSDDQLACRVYGKLCFSKPIELHASSYKGTMYGCKSGKIEYLVTPNHRMLVSTPWRPDVWRIVTAPEIHGKERRFDCKHEPYEPDAPEDSFSLPTVEGNNSTKLVGPANYYRVDYEGSVYCATVPGGLLYVRRGEGVGFWCGNSEKTGVVLQLASGVKKSGKDLKVRAYNTKTKKVEWIDPVTAVSSVVAFPDQYNWKGAHPKPVAKNVKVSDKEGTITLLPPAKVDYVLSSTKGMFDFSANMIPFLQSNQGNRTMVASKQLEQAVPLVHREVPLVQTKGDRDKTFEDGVGAFNSHSSPIGGVVKQVKKDGIVIQGDDGQRHEVQLYHDFPLNDARSLINSTALVKAGDSVRKGQLVADTNFTKDGTLALGTNLKVAYTPYKGYNFEDGIIISEGAAKKLTSEHMHREAIRKETNIVMHKDKFLAASAGTVTKEQANKLDDEGIIKPGEVVQPGDILIGALRKEEIRPEEQKLGLFSKKLLKPVRPRPQKWTKEVPGVVNRVVKHGKDVTVHVKSMTPATIGDKIVGRHGNKGIITCHDDQTEVLTGRGWISFKDVSTHDTICTLNPDTHSIEYHVPKRVISESYQGKMWTYSGRRLDLCVTPSHRHYVRTRLGAYKFETADACAGMPRIHLRTGHWSAEEMDTVEIPGVPYQTCDDGRVGPRPQFRQPVKYNADDFLEFFGYWVTEGCLDNSSHIHIGQSREKNPETYFNIKRCLERLGYNVYDGPATLVISDPRLHCWLSQFGKATDKFIPRDFLLASTRQLKILADAVFDGDGGTYYREKDNHTRRELFTSSKRLADDYQELALKIGISANIKPQVRKDRTNTEYVVRWSFKEEVWTNNDKRYDNEKWVAYDGRVYCVEVPNHVVYVRRNGIPVWSGNSILPDNEMPHDKTGQSMDVLLNPTGVPTRINLGQVMETAASKIARKKKKPYVVNNFDPENKDYTRNLITELEANGLSDTEDLTDPVSNRKLKNVLVGDQYILKLHHMAEKGLQTRSRDKYDSNMTPKEGGPTGGQTMDALGLYALLAHNARHNIREFQSYKSDFNDDFWTSIQAGDPIPPPKIPFVHKKFEGYMKGMGLDVVKDGNSLVLGPLTDKKVKEMSGGRVIKDPSLMLRGKDATPEPKGLFDPQATGTLSGTSLGDKWAHFPLAEAMPSPFFEKPIRSLLGVKETDFNAVLSGDKEMGGKTGPSAIVDEIKKIDVDKQLAETEPQLNRLKGSALNKANKKVKYLKTLKRLKMSPTEAYTTSLVPVMPPVMRPYTVLDDGSIKYDDVNELYKQVGASNDQLKRIDPAMPEDTKIELQKEVYDGLKGLALTGMTSRRRHFSGIAETVAGKTQPKEGYFQNKVIGRRQDLSLRGTIVPEPSISLDEVAIPRKAAAELYKPFTVRRLVRLGYTPLQAQRQVNENSSIAKQALEVEASERPVLLKRDPVLHKFGVQAFKPVLTEGKAVKIHPLVTGGYNADFDGDKMSAYLPVSQKAVREAYGMMPSKNLFSPAHGKVMFKPGHEAQMGLFKLTEVGKKSNKKFSNLDSLGKALESGEVGIDELVSIGDPGGDLNIKLGAKPVRTTAGRLAVYKALPPALRGDKLLTDPTFLLDKGQLAGLLTDVAKSAPDEFAVTADSLKDMGNAYATGMSISLKDFVSDKEVRDPIFAKAREQEAKIRATKASTAKKNTAVVDLYVKAAEELDRKAKPRAGRSGNRMYDWIKSGARGDWDQYKQMTLAPVLVADSSGNPVPIPITKSYSEGQDIGSYWATMHGARMGTIGRAQGTRQPGMLSKQMSNVSMRQVVVDEDCGATKGTRLSLNDRDVLGRYTSEPISLGVRGGKDKGSIPAGTLVDTAVLNRIKNNRPGDDTVRVRTPLRCRHGDGMCAKCFGLNENGQLHEPGANVGIMAAHALGEPATQLAMNCNAAGNLVTVKAEYDTHTLTFEEFWDSVPSFVDVEEAGVVGLPDIETKVPLDAEIWDHDRFVPVLTIQRHKPLAKMVLVRTESGRTLVVEGDHPMWARSAVPICSATGCACEEPVRFVGHYKDGSKTSVRCSKCHQPFQISPEEYELQQERVVRAADLEGYYVGVSEAVGEGAMIEESPLPPYLLGIYVSEGNVRRTKNTHKPKLGSKKRQTSPYGLFWKPLGVCFTQNQGEVRDRILEELKAAGISYTENSEKGITLHDVGLARELWSRCGTGSHAVRLPKDWTTWGHEALKLVLAGILDGDGTSKDGDPQLDTTSWALASQVAEIVRTLGGYACIYDTKWREASAHQGYRVSIKLGCHLPSVKGFEKCSSPPLPKGSYSKVVSVKEVEYEGWTYDVSTPSRAFSSNGVRNHNSFHTGGVVGAKGTAMDHFKRLNQLLKVPTKLPGSATLAATDGKVESIKKDPAGGWNVMVKGERHYVPQRRQLVVEKGSMVRKGESLSSGPKNPRELLKHTNLGAVQRILTDEIYDIYRDEGPVRRRNIETFVRALTNLGQVTDPGDHPEFLPGDRVPVSEVNAFNDSLKAKGANPVKIEPMLKSVEHLPRELETDWIARMNGGYLRQTLVDAAAEGWKSRVHSTHPIPAMAVAKEFGLGTPDSPYLY